MPVSESKLFLLAPAAKKPANANHHTQKSMSASFSSSLPIALTYARSIYIGTENITGMVVNGDTLIFSDPVCNCIRFVKTGGTGVIGVIKFPESKETSSGPPAKPFDIALSSDKARLFISQDWSGDIRNMSLSTPSETTILNPNWQDPKSVTRHLVLTLDRETQELFAHDVRSKCINIFSESTGTLLRRIDIKNAIARAGVLPLGFHGFNKMGVIGDNIWASPFACDKILIIEKQEGTTVHSVAIGGPDACASGLIEVGELVFVGDASNKRVVILHKTTREVVGKFEISVFRPTIMAVSEDSKTLFILDKYRNDIGVFNIRQPLAVSFLCGLHSRAGKSSRLNRARARCAIFDIQALRLSLRLAGALFYLRNPK